MFIFTLILFVVSFVLSELLRPKPDIENARPANLGDFQFPTATQGRIVPLVWGTVKLEAPNVVWYGGLVQLPIKEKIKTGMWSSQTFIKGYRYYVGVQHALCRGPVDKLLRIWVGDDVIWEAGLTGPGSVYINEWEWFGGDDLGNGGLQGTMRFYTGSETQNADSYLSTYQQQGGDTPSYRGTCYCVWDGGYVGNSTSIDPWRFEVQRIPNPLGLATPGVNSNMDANPANVIYELLTNTEWGLGFPAADIDTANFSSVAGVLLSEGNGFSFILDQALEVTDFLREVERQIDGVVVLDRLTGKWRINLARGGYDVDDLPQATPDNVAEVKDFSRGAWDETSNEIRVNFTNRDNKYISDFAAAQDLANVHIQNANVVNTCNYPGVKNATLANNLAWRDLRGLSRPLAKVTLSVNREFHAVNPGDVIAWTEPSLGITKMPMRLTKVDIGTLQDGRITLAGVEDIFTFEAPSFAPPQSTKWVYPADTMLDILAANRVIFEAPKAFTDKDPVYPGVRRRIWCGARAQGDGAVLFDLVVSNQIVVRGCPFLLAGKLNASLTGSAHGLGVNIDILPDPDSKALLLAAVDFVANAVDIGVYLAHIVMVNGEFIGFESISDQGATVRLTSCYRGLMDSAAAAHAANDRVWFLFVAGCLTETAFSGTPVSVKPIPYSRSDRLDTAAATASSVPLIDRHLKPYPPATLRLNSTSYPSSVAIDTAVGASDDGKGVQTDFVRRDYRTVDEVSAVLDETSLPSDFPTANNTRYAIEVRNDPQGTNTLLFTTAYASGNSVDLSRTEILRYTNGVVPSRMRVAIKTRHTISAVDHDATQNLTHDFNVTDTELSGKDNLGSLDDGETSAQYTAPDTGTYAFQIFQNLLTTGAVQARRNAGAWVPVITPTNTTGNLTGVVTGDIIEVRHTENASNTNQTLLKITAPTAGFDAYGVLIV